MNFPFHSKIIVPMPPTTPTKQSQPIMKIKIKPFTVPNFVILDIDGLSYSRAEGMPSFPLSAVDPNELSNMCSSFRRGCFLKAGFADPLPPNTPDTRTAAIPPIDGQATVAP